MKISSENNARLQQFHGHAPTTGVVFIYWRINIKGRERGPTGENNLFYDISSHWHAGGSSSALLTRQVYFESNSTRRVIDVGFIDFNCRIPSSTKKRKNVSVYIMMLLAGDFY